MTIYCSRSFSSLLNYTDLDQYSRMAIESIGAWTSACADAAVGLSGTTEQRQWTVYSIDLQHRRRFQQFELYLSMPHGSVRAL